MRLLNKFYSFIKSIYLNNSKFSNNLRHTLRIFFEREIKTKHTPTLFGSTFKGSKWVDYQTFNINKLFIKSGLSYFIYMLLVFLMLLLLLGRSKSEQYFGFFPFFSYINFILGYIPLVLNDLTSQVVLLLYSLYIVLTNFLYSVLNYVNGKSFSFLNNHYKKPNEPSLTKNVKNFDTLFNNTTTKLNNTNTLLPKFSKTLSVLSKNVALVTSTDFRWKSKYLDFFTLNKDVHYSTIKLKKDSFIKNSNTITNMESFYLNSKSLNTSKVKNIKTDINSILKISKVLKKAPNFNYNIENNLNISKQQRWLAKNSLLSESITNNTFLITQAKKLLGSNTLDKDFSSSTLWLPTKVSKLSSIESNMYLNSLNQQLFSNNINNNFLKTHTLTWPSFNNLNLFENSRIWVFKKYFF